MNVLARATSEIAVGLRGVPLIPRWTIVGAATACVSGGIVGLIVGLLAYAPTAWFAVLELGVPAGVVGGIAGLVGALIVTAGRGIKRLITPSR
jgi:membrane associated rhomboid family serine protease